MDPFDALAQELALAAVGYADNSELFVDEVRVPIVFTQCDPSRFMPSSWRFLYREPYELTAQDPPDDAENALYTECLNRGGIKTPRRQIFTRDRPPRTFGRWLTINGFNNGKCVY